ncbi:L-ribulose-5-phosphate 3-epimerase/hexulose-6-phosphate isomerase [Salana multivorans]|uniref:L-ribulose-5-phosphate 3-epimerase/hexulose-6-phosphate isomerase n=1 Tax=Salana multivorans TaxID=120377 RepID=A0A3N2D957_9MICO|nr:L-ribulose-5-phosphate 3-epimerase [Salana multivorans]OJX97333.1 MAG: hypothetical protein BGO96_05185 [Micrococcales bacterium 73-15]ROR96325.1 L-ribulose-5-phosphate 3-epimerase/hexulose-6-phosphate isomerase [Salana multivorans]
MADELDRAEPSARRPSAGVALGVYEKAMPRTNDWDALFGNAREAGYTFVDLSVDESPERIDRLAWEPAERRRVVEAAHRQEMALGALCLSAHRAIGPGSAHRHVRRRALAILLEAIDLCADLGVSLLQVAGYYAYYEPADPGARQRYVDVLRAGADHAARRGVLLGIENVDGTDITSIGAASRVCDDVGSAYLGLYPDVGNLAEQGLDVVEQLRAGHGRMFALHVKDTLPGHPRFVPMGNGIVPWEAAFAELARQEWSGRVLVEMWNDSEPDALEISSRAREFIVSRLTDAGIPLISPWDVDETLRFPAQLIALGDRE